ncbi:hypothetical protein BDR26DRAFT_858205 [Obelidium mucronatum]|nr:hypothetical protein BDR26DRAFT_858205 [Obelidium mucronatum]
MDASDPPEPQQPQPRQPPKKGKAAANAKYIICPFGPPIQLRPDGRRRRFHAARDQIVLLENLFRINKKPNAKERIEICKQVNMNPRSLQVTGRAKDKKDGGTSATGGGTMSPITPETGMNPFGINPTISNQEEELPRSPFVVHTLLTTSVSIGSWRRLSLTPEDLLCEIIVSDGLLRWSVIESGFCFKMELPITAINDMSVHSVPENASLSSLVLQTNMPPSFYRQTQPGETSSSSLNGFVACSDFTEHMQASTVLCHILEGSHAEMEKGFSLLQNYFNEKYFVPASAVSSQTSPNSAFAASGTTPFPTTPFAQQGSPSGLVNPGLGLAINTAAGAIQDRIHQPQQHYYYSESAPISNASAFHEFLNGGPLSASVVGVGGSESFPLSMNQHHPHHQQPPMGPMHHPQHTQIHHQMPLNHRQRLNSAMGVDHTPGTTGQQQHPNMNNLANDHQGGINANPNSSSFPFGMTDMLGMQTYGNF